MRRTTLARGTAGLDRRQRLTRSARPVAGRRRPELDIPAATRELLRARSRGRCEGLVFDAGCTVDATDAHHRKRRRDGGHAITNLLDLCRACHAWAHVHPAEARRLGLIVSAFEDPADVPLLLLSHLTGLRTEVLLLVDGGLLVDGDLAIAADGTLSIGRDR